MRDANLYKRTKAVSECEIGLKSCEKFQGIVTDIEVIYKTRETVFHQDIQTPRSGLKKRGAASFLTDFEVFGYLMKHSFEFLIWLLKPCTILGEIQSKIRKILC